MPDSLRLTDCVCVQAAEAMLNDYWIQITRVLTQLQGMVTIAAPAVPLAMTNLLACIMPGAAASLATTQHPVVQVSCQQTV